MWPFKKKTVEGQRERELEMDVAVLRSELATYHRLAEERMAAVWKWQEKAGDVMRELDLARNRGDMLARLLEAHRSVSVLALEVAYKNRQGERPAFETAETHGLGSEFESVALARAAIRGLGCQLAVESVRAREAVASLHEAKKNQSVCSECSCAIIIDE